MCDRPTCINPGCGEPVTYSRQNKDGTYRWRIHCGHCQKASYGGHPHRPGVTPYKTGRCSNHDGHLGFPCSTNHDLHPEWAKGLTEVDHKDGNHANNHPDNLDELCIICHKIKGQSSGDFNRFKPKATVVSNLNVSTIIDKKSMRSYNSKNSRAVFNRLFNYVNT